MEFGIFPGKEKNGYSDKIVYNLIINIYLGRFFQKKMNNNKEIEVSN
jgi:hypothetical protein